MAGKTLIVMILASLGVMALSMKSMTGEDTQYKKATFAGGCFWCMEPPFEKLDGVREVISGYTGGKEKDPTYAEVSSGMTGHTEAIRILYDPSKVSYEKLLEVFWMQVDPTDPGGQFVDRGPQYRTGIFWHDEEQKRLAEESKQALERSGRYQKPVVTEIVEAGPFYPAEGYHQDYYKKSPVRYKLYRMNSGRDSHIERLWGDGGAMKEPGREETPSGRGKSQGKSPYDNIPARETLKQQLSPLQFHVTQENGTERPFHNAFWDNKEEGIYVDVVSGEPLFSSSAKFESGTGWPSFVKPLEPENVLEKRDNSHGMMRTEVRSRHADSHLGHVFPDGPAPTGLRYCINSAALRFIPKKNLEEEGYGRYRALFDD